MPDPSVHIVVCVEHVDRLPRVFTHAAALARSANARLSVLHIAGSGGGDDHAALQRALEELVAEHGADARVVVRAADRRRSVAEAIADVAAEMKAGLIALDSRDLTMLRHALRGSIAMDLVAATATPVMVASTRVQAPRAAEDFHLVVTSDGSPKADRVVDRVRAFMGLANVRFTLLQFYIPRIGDEGRLLEMESCEQRLEALRGKILPSTPIDCRVDMPDELESVPHAILRLGRELGADALVMSTQGASAARHVLIGSVALAVAQYAQIPVILVRA